jgi:hypothetical protein
MRSGESRGGLNRELAEAGAKIIRAAIEPSATSQLDAHAISREEENAALGIAA